MQISEEEENCLFQAREMIYQDQSALQSHTSHANPQESSKHVLELVSVMHIKVQLKKNSMLQGQGTMKTEKTG